MTVSAVDIVSPGVKMAEDQRFVNTYQATYKISCTAEHGPLYIQTNARLVGSTPVPVKGDYFNVASETDTSSFALDFQWRRDEHTKKRWYCDVTWRPKQPNEGSVPLSRSMYWWEFEEYTKVVQNAKTITNLTTIARGTGTDGPIVNAANRRYETPLEVPASRAVLVISINYSTLDKVRIAHATFSGKLNSDTYNGATTKQLLCRRITSGQPFTENSTTYWPGLIYIAYNPDGWKHQVVNYGYGYFTTDADTSTYSDLNADGTPITEPVNLKATGGKLSDGSVGNIIEYEYGDTISFASGGPGSTAIHYAS